MSPQSADAVDAAARIACYFLQTQQLDPKRAERRFWSVVKRTVYEIKKSESERARALSTGTARKSYRYDSWLENRYPLDVEAI